MTTHTEETIAMALACLLIALFGYPFGGTSIVPFDAMGAACCAIAGTF